MDKQHDQRRWAARRKTSRLGFGDFARPDSEVNDVVWSVRLRMFAAAREVYPKFLDALATGVLPKYRRWSRAQSDLEGILWANQPFKGLNGTKLQTALLEWADQFNARRDWLLDQALLTLWSWSHSQKRLKSREWYSLGNSCGQAMCGENFQLKVPGWELLVYRWPEYSEWVLKQCEQALRIYKRKADEYAKTQGLIRAPKYYREGNLEWFVLYQFAGMSSVQIADRLSQGEKYVDLSTILKGVKSAAKLIAWGPLRPWSK